MRDVEIDQRTRAALDRLTAGEKECLARRLQHQTAKEIALELGVSPHAVEKRLKMARAKLGLSSSLDAARLLAAAEGYQRTAPRAPDLALAGAAADKRAIRMPALGAIAMTLVATTLIVLAAQTAGSGGGTLSPENNASPAPALDTSRPATGPNGRPIVWTAPPSETVVPTAAEMHMVVTASFSVMDKDRSGFIEVAETPVEGTATIEQKIYSRDDDGQIRETGEVRRVSAEQARAEYIARGDTDHDGKWSFDEYREWMKPHLAKNGIPTRWREDIESHY